MMSDEKTVIQFDILIRSADGALPDAGNIDIFKPDPNAVFACMQWLQQQGIRVYQSELGLAAETDKPRFESVFNVDLIAAPPGRPGPPFSMGGKPYFPEDIREMIAEMTLSAAPDLFPGAKGHPFP